MTDGATGKPVLIINGESSVTGPLADELATAGVDAVFCAIDELTITIDDWGVRVTEPTTRLDLSEFGLVHVLSYQRRNLVLLSAVAEYLATTGVQVLNTTHAFAPTMLYKYVRLATRGLRVPSTLYFPTWELMASFDILATTLGLPFVLKTPASVPDRLTTLIPSESAFVSRLRNLELAGYGYLAQELIPTKTDHLYVALVMGGEVKLALKRECDLTATPLPSDEASSELIVLEDFDEEGASTAVAAVEALGYEMAGVSLIRHWTNDRWYVTNVTTNPTIADGCYAADIASVYSAYLKRRLIAL